MDLLTENSTLDPRARFRDLSCEIPLCLLMTPGVCKIRRGCNALQAPIQIIPLGMLKRESHPVRSGSKL